MAALTPTSSEYTVFGNKQVLITTLDPVADADTFAPPGFGIIDHVKVLSDESNVAQVTVSGTTITFQIAAGTPGLTLEITGS